MSNKTFAEFFKQFRLQSSIPSLVDLSNKLIDENIYYDYSIYSKWQSGQRVPTDRNTILSIIKVFIKNSGINTIKQANDLLRSLNQKDLDEFEIEAIFNCASLKKNTLPINPGIIEKTSELKKIVWNTLNGQSILLYGLSGVGKTTLAIQAGNLINDKYSRNIFWYRADITSLESIVNSLAREFGEDYSQVKNLNLKLSRVKKLLSDSRSLLILDNVLESNILDLFDPSSEFKYQIIATSIDGNVTNNFFRIKIGPFNKKEAMILSSKILGETYVRLNIDCIKKIIDLSKCHPLILSICLKQIRKSPKLINSIVNDLLNNRTSIDKLNYDNKTLLLSLLTITNKLSDLEKTVFFSLAIFNGKDFSKDAIRYINEIDEKTCKLCIEKIAALSLIEKSNDTRYRIHPLILTFLRKQKLDIGIIYRSMDYYLSIFKKHNITNTKNYKLIDDDIDNILYIFKKILFLNNFQKMIIFWEYISIYAHDKGMWKEKENLIKEMIFFYKKNKNIKCLPDLYTSLGWIYFWQGKINDSKRLYLKSIELSKENSDKYQFSLASQRLAVLLQFESKNEKAEKLLIDSLGVFKKYKYITEICNSYLYLGHVYFNRMKYLEAEKYYKKSLFLANKSKNLTVIAIANSYLGMNCLETGNFTKAKKYILKSLKMDHSYNRKSGIAWCFYGLASMNEKMGKYSLAKKLLQKSLEIFTELEMRIQVKEISKKLKDAKFFHQI